MSVHRLRSVPPVGSQWSDPRSPKRVYTVKGIIAPPAIHDSEHTRAFAHAVERGKAYCRDGADGSLRLIPLAHFAPAPGRRLNPVRSST